MFGPQAQALMADLNTEGQHRGYVKNVLDIQKKQDSEEHKHDANGHTCEHGADCQDPSHHHHHDKHDHGHHHEHGESCKEHGCTDPSHDHSHGKHAQTTASKRCAAFFSRHQTSVQSYILCGCMAHADLSALHCLLLIRNMLSVSAHTSNMQDFGSAWQHSKWHLACRFGITSFVYSRRRPFHPHRLREMVVQWMPVSNNKETGATVAPENNSSPIRTVMRSKGFMWLSSGHATAFYWSHAGMHFEIRCAQSNAFVELVSAS